MRIEYGLDSITFSAAGSAWEEWYVIYRDGRVTYHGENDGWTFMRRGPEAVNREATQEELVRWADSRLRGLEVWQTLSLLRHPLYHTHVCRDASYGHLYPCVSGFGCQGLDEKPRGKWGGCPQHPPQDGPDWAWQRRPSYWYGEIDWAKLGAW